ncbi:LPS export ABC transporter periplasmic protein LptC [Massilia sp. Root418]|jgi:lipopolysaccharide export system protein LptC|uniref:LPS export ABC transporter periplasmic protein LptC n=1 Tax=Massilia sp. Root418 TaxID=1736532 RepID=UPI0006FE31BE|nr:LPS export ABC transporter periplasmic protein LptC [Massilia sp. Root418]KQW87958.1 LPS export ABC transporter periplasmic protein LptC [Massilia sp. Root418]
MRKRTAHRWRLTLTLVFGVLFACGTFWLVQLLNRGEEDMLADKRLNEPDYIIDQFSVVRMTKDGKPSYIVAGDKLVHRPIDDASEIDKPMMRNLSSTQPPMNITAEHARVDESNTRVQLKGNVKIDRAAQGKSAAMQMTTQALTVYPDEDRMETDQPVQIVQGGATATGTGMKANNATRMVHLQGRGAIVFPPKGAPANTK